jgi:very-short-patch-repair endonuclease
MTDVAALVVGLAGMARKQQLVARGATDYDLTVAVRTGAVRRARNGWYSTLPEESPAFRAVRVGGRLTGMYALVALGAWAYPTFPLHVSLPRNAARQRSQWSRRVAITRLARRGVVLHWDEDDVVSRGTATSVSVMDALYRAILDEPLEVAVAALDWAFTSNRMDLVDFERLMLRLPAWARAIRFFVDWKCDSLPESVSRTRLLLRGLRVRSQVRVGEFEEIDLVIEECIGLEVDGHEYHRDRFELDRRKDLKITLERLHALRFSYQMIFTMWPTVLAAIEIVLEERGVPLPSGNSGISPGQSPSAPKKPGIPTLPQRPRTRFPEFP